MAKENIKNYILQNKNNYAREQITQSLQTGGYKIEDINQVYSELNLSSSPPNTISNEKPVEKKKSSTMKIILIIIVIFGMISSLIFIYFAFFYVDLGALLPNKVDISTQHIMGDVANSIAFSNEYSFSEDRNMVIIGFRYTGSQKSLINSNNVELKTMSDKSCTPIEVSNVRVESNGKGEDINFLSSHDGYIKFDCSNLELISKEVIEGTISIGVEDSKTNKMLPSVGKFRLNIQ